MRTSHKLTRIFVALFALIVMAGAALAGQPDPTNTAVSDQKAGSVLVFPYYNSDGTQGAVNTRISISNVGASDFGPGESTYMHLFFLRGTDCSQADIFICPTPNGSTVFDVNSFDPGVKGWLIGVAVDQYGAPTQANRFIGNAYVRDNDVIGNYAAEAFAKISAGSVAVANDASTLNFNGTDYDMVPGRHQVELLSPNDAQQRIITVRVGGTIGGTITGAGATGVSVWYDENEKGYSGPSWVGNCQSDYAVTPTIRTVPRLGTVIPSGRSGQVAFNTNGTVGLLLTSTKKADGSNAAWSGIRGLHKFRPIAATLSMPVFMPTC